MQVLDLILKWAVPFICGSAISGCITYAKMVRKRDKALDEGVCCLLRAEILRNYKEYSRKGFCPNYAKEAENKAYKAYHALGGNDIATDKHNFIMSLPDEEPSFPKEATAV